MPDQIIEIEALKQICREFYTEKTDLQCKIKTLATLADVKMIECWALQKTVEYQDKVIRKLQSDLRTAMMYLGN